MNWTVTIIKTHKGIAGSGKTYLEISKNHNLMTDLFTSDVKPQRGNRFISRFQYAIDETTDDNKNYIITILNDTSILIDGHANKISVYSGKFVSFKDKSWYFLLDNDSFYHSVRLHKRL